MLASLIKQASMFSLNDRNHLWIELKYVQLISGRLERYKLKKSSPFAANFRCPVCGDSQTNNHKARGYITQRSNSLFFRCYNCGVSQRFSTFLKQQDSALYSQYRMECFTEDHRNDPARQQQPAVAKTSVADFNTTPHFEKPINWVALSKLPFDHPARKYIVDRKLPGQLLSDLYAVDNFYQFINESIDPEQKYSAAALKNDHPRIIIPLRTREGKLYGVQGRTYLPKDARRPKYLTSINKHYIDHPLVYGLEKIDDSKPIVIVEGPFDSLLVDNAIAALGAQSILATIARLPYAKEQYIIALDNDKRNIDVINAMEKAIDQGFRVVVWPAHFVWGDINKAILSGQKTSSDINEIIADSARTGLLARIELNVWRKTRKIDEYSRSYKR